MTSQTPEELDAMKVAYNALEPLDEDARLRAFAWLADALKVSAIGPGRPDQLAPPVPSGTGGMGAKAFMATKKPGTDVERVTCLAYYLTHGKATQHFKTAELTELNVEAAGRSFSNISQAAKDAVKADYLSSAGQGRRQITPLGEGVVEALPDKAAVKAFLEAEASRRRRRRRRARPKKAQ